MLKFSLTLILETRQDSTVVESYENRTPSCPTTIPARTGQSDYPAMNCRELQTILRLSVFFEVNCSV